MLPYQSMQKGFNSDVNVGGKKFHVQTEDWGHQNPYLVTRIFLNGAVFKTVKTPYQQILNKTLGDLETFPSNLAESIQKALRQQHTLVVEKLVSGDLR